MPGHLASHDFNSVEFERKQVAERVAKRLKRIAVLREEITELTRENVKDRFYIATHRLLPREVLSEIFAYTATGGSGSWLAPFVISHVSSHWRVSATNRSQGGSLTHTFGFGYRAW